jgi:Arc/MetJ-type ribon-helix-helix transcriptional regulator
MAKVSVYIPDELWERSRKAVKAAGAKATASHVVQTALERMLREEEARTERIAEGAKLDRARVDAVVEKLREGARVEFERGYDLGLRIAESIGFEGLNYIVSYNSADIRDWLQAQSDLDPAFEGVPGIDSIEFDELSNLQDEGMAIRRAGADRAIIDLWNALRREGWQTPRPLEEPPSIDEEGIE